MAVVPGQPELDNITPPSPPVLSLPPPPPPPPPHSSRCTPISPSSDDEGSAALNLPTFETTTPSSGFDPRRKSSAPSLQLRTTFPVNTLAPHCEEARHDETSRAGVSRPTTPRPSPLALSTVSKGHLYSGEVSPALSISSPALAFLKDVTPLPSPIGYSQAPDLWRKVTGGPRPDALERDGLGRGRAPSPVRRKKIYHGLSSAQPSTVDVNFHNHALNRSISEYIPDHLHNVRPRNVTMGPVRVPLLEDHEDRYMHREEHVAAQRRAPTVSLPDHQSTNRLLPSPTSHESADHDQWDESPKKTEESFESLEVHDLAGKEVKKWRPIQRLGQGAFSEVLLAVAESSSPEEQHQSGAALVAVKIVNRNLEHGLDEERVGTGLKREIDILQSISHPCLPQLKGFDENDQRTLLVLNYCPGGDLFELASQQRELLTPALIQRVFAEIVGAVSYLHGEYIVHRDIKLENVLLNLQLADLSTLAHPTNSYPYPLITLTDLGLSRRISRPPESALLSHACGSADYAAPELLLGQSYDGRATDAWALGVLLYALLEGRLPFDPLGPGPNGRKRAGGGSVKHRIARVDWLWVENGDEDGEWKEDTKKGKQLLEASRIVDGCLKKAGRGRWSVQKIGEVDWIRDGILVEGGLKRQDIG